MGMSGQRRAFRFNPREFPLTTTVPMRMVDPQSRSGQLREERNLLLCLGNKPPFTSLPFLSLSPYIDWKYICADKMYTYLCNKRKNANGRKITFKKFQRDDTLYSTLLFPVSRSTCFGHIPCPSSGAQLTVLTVSGVDKQCVSSRRRGWVRTEKCFILYYWGLRTCFDRFCGHHQAVIIE
jgi:hypothetical protein